MPITSSVIIPPITAANAYAVQYTSTAVITSIDKFTATNWSAAAATITVHLVSANTALGNDNMVVKTKTIAAGATYLFPEIVGHILEVGDYISTIAGTADSINIRASGREITL